MNATKVNAVCRSSYIIFVCIYFQVANHSSCQELCLFYAFGHCNESHPDSSDHFTTFYDLCELVSDAITTITDEEQRGELTGQWSDSIKTHWSYCAHLMRTKHQADYYR